MRVNFLRIVKLRDKLSHVVKIIAPFNTGLVEPGIGLKPYLKIELLRFLYTVPLTTGNETAKYKSVKTPLCQI